MKFLDRINQVSNDITSLKEGLTRYAADTDVGDLVRPGDDGRIVKFAKGGGISKEALILADLINKVRSGRKPDYLLKEAMTTSDFPNLMGDLLYRTMLGNFTAYPVTYPGYFRTTTVKDFRTLHMYTIDGGQNLLGKVKEREPYPEITFTEGAKTLSVFKYGRRYSITFEMLVNDDLNAFNTRPQLMAEGARRSEEYLATTMLADANGPHASFFTSGNANIVTGNPVFSIQGLQTAMTVLAKQKDTEGQPIVITSYALVVGPALSVSMDNVLHALQIRINDNSGGGTSGQFLYANNWMKGKVTGYVNPYLPYVSSSANGDTQWYLIANPNDIGQRPAFVFGKLRGYEDPQLFVKSNNSTRLGGGAVDTLDGDFESDAIDYKLRTFMGASQIEPKMAVASNGSGS